MHNPNGRPIHDRATWAHRVRPECRVHEMSIGEKIGYLWKYLISPRTSAPASILAYFGQQRRIQAILRLREYEAGIRPVLARIALAGDIMWVRSQWDRFLPPATLAKLQGLDGIVANLETIISPRFKVNEFLPDVLRFNSDSRLITSFRHRDGGSLFAALGLANNHALDFGDAGAKDTLDFLIAEGISSGGLLLQREAPLWSIFCRAGIKFGFFSACFGMNDHLALERSALHVNVLPGLAPDRPGAAPDLSLAVQALQEMEAAGVEVKIVYLHWGSEFEFYPTPRMMRAARALVEAGADFVVGTHPHVPQPMEVIFVNGSESQLGLPAALPARCLLSTPDRVPRKACVLYSMGNFTTTMFTFFCRSALLAEVQFYREGGSKRSVAWSLPALSYLFNRPPRCGEERALLPLHEFLESMRGTKNFSELERKGRFLQDLVACDP